MARLKVKQISDFTSEVNALVSAANASVLDSINSLEVTDSTQSTAIAANLAAIGTNDTDISNLQDSVNALEAVDSTQSIAIAGLIAVDSTQSTAIAANTTAIATILDGSTTDLDQFSELVAFVNSIDSLGSLDLVGHVANASATDSVHSTAIANLIVTDSTQSTAIAANLAAIGTNDTDISNLQASVNALEAVDSTQSTAIAANLAAIGTNDTDISNLQGSVDSLESIDSILSAAIASNDTDISNLQSADLRLHQFGTVVTTTSFTIPVVVDVAATADTLVFINGHNIHVESDGVDGWKSPDGQTFNLNGIGYDIDPTDHIYVVAPRG